MESWTGVALSSGARRQIVGDGATDADDRAGAGERAAFGREVRLHIRNGRPRGDERRARAWTHASVIIATVQSGHSRGDVGS
jgi:hypothetical protein